MNYYEREKQTAEWLNDGGFSFDFTDHLWMEDVVKEHTWRDVIELIHDYHDEHKDK